MAGSLISVLYESKDRSEKDVSKRSTIMGEKMEKDIRERYKRLTELLIEKGLYISTMESCTGGLIASLITDTEGASAIMKGAFVTYSNEAKIMQGVDRNIIEKNGVYSAETARAMALACKRTYHSDIGIGVTGTMRNTDPANPYGIPGRAYFAIALDNEIYDHVISYDEPDRFKCKQIIAAGVEKELTKLLK